MTSIAAAAAVRTGLGGCSGRFAHTPPARSWRAGSTAQAVGPGHSATDGVRAVPEKTCALILPQIPAGRSGKPEGIARSVAFLVCSETGFVNGSTISANGGQFFA